MLHVLKVMLHANINKLHVSIIILHVDIIYVACKGLNYSILIMHEGNRNLPP